MSLPRFILLKSHANNKYLCYAKEKGPTHAFLRFSHEMNHQKAADFLESEKNDESLKTEFHFLKFEVEEAKTAKGLVHIRTCYNHKYWVRKSADTNRIVAEANEPEEDQTKWSCTLFKPIILGVDDETDSFVPHGDKPQKIQLIHVSQLGQHYVVGSTKTRDGHEFDLVTSNPESKMDFKSDSSVMFTAYNVVATAILPYYMTFIGHDDKYIAAFGGNNLGFVTTDIGTTGVAMYTFPTSTPQYIPLIIRGSNMLWYLNPYNDVGLATSTTNTYFAPINVGDYIALYCQANNNFVHRVNTGSYDGTGARISSITEEAKLRVGEPVISRNILSVNYDLEDSRIYDTSSAEMYVDSSSNNTDVEQTGMFEVEYKITHTMSWNQSLTVHVGIEVTWSFGIPEFGDAGLNISYDFTATSEWDEEKAQEKTITYTQNVVIPPRKRVTLRVLATKALCDVPFTCVVSDVMTDGTTRQYTKTDGMFVGSNEFQFTTVIDEDDV